MKICVVPSQRNLIFHGIFIHNNFHVFHVYSCYFKVTLFSDEVIRSISISLTVSQIVIRRLLLSATSSEAHTSRDHFFIAFFSVAGLS